MPDSARARALVLERPHHLVIHDIPLPIVGDDDALVRVEACGLCGTDHEQYTGELAGGFAGDRVAVEVFQSCRDCKACVDGEYRRCERHGLADMYGFISVDRAPGLWGGYAEHQYLAPDSMVLPVPAALDPVVATMFNPLGAGIRWGATIPGTGPGDVVAVLGPGIRGLCVAAAAKDAGAEFVMMTGIGARDADRLELADVVVDGTRGWGAGAPGFIPDMVVLKELRIVGALGVDATAYRAVLDVLASGRYPFAELPRRCVGLDEGGDLLATMAGERDGVPPVHGVVAP
jgi:alcohol dehydrogenase